MVVDAVEVLLEANRAVGAVRVDVRAEDFIRAIAGIWQIDVNGDWRAQAGRLLDLVMDGLRVGAPGRI
jgi:hypothetical protein